MSFNVFLFLYKSFNKISTPMMLAIIQITCRKSCGGGAVGKSVRPASGRLGVGIPAVTDLSR